MIRTTVKVEGLRELSAALRQLRGEDQYRACVSATAAAAQVIKKRWIQNLRRNPSVDTGILVANVITKKVPRSQSTATSEHVVTIRKRFYPRIGGARRRNTRQVANYLEFGTVKMAAEPAARPAFDSGKEAAVAAMVARLKAKIAKLSS